MSLGVGIFVLPATLKQMGMVSGLVAILWFAVWSYTMQCILIKVAKKQTPPVYSYEELAERVLGKPGAVLLAFFTAVTTFLGNAAHMKTVIALLQDILEFFVTGDYGKYHWSMPKLLIAYFFLLSVALVKSANRQISRLRYISTASVGMVLLICVWCIGECLFWYWPKGHHAFSGDNRVILASTDWKIYAQDLPAVAFAFSGTFCLFPVYNEMNDKSFKNVKKAIGISSVVCGVGYASVALIGVLTFGKKVDQDANDPTKEHYVITFMSFILVGTITLLYAVLNFPFLGAMTQLINMLPGGTGDSAFLRRRPGRMVMTVAGMIGVVVVNLGFKNLLALFGFCGGWGISFVVYFIPSVIALADSKGEPLWYQCALAASALLVLVLAAGFTFTLFYPP